MYKGNKRRIRLRTKNRILSQLLQALSSEQDLVLIKDISNRELAHEFGETGRAKVVEKYSWEDTVKKTVRLYKGLV
ncbi:Glycosyltransferase involved in cell wall bisynthesis [Candidatus Methanophagaceae archaeon]|nr:Glycosyltransferase involved in cell wall bisynthesis [Methanophagales archaeon]